MVLSRLTVLVALDALAQQCSRAAEVEMYHGAVLYPQACYAATAYEAAHKSEPKAAHSESETGAEAEVPLVACTAVLDRFLSPIHVLLLPLVWIFPLRKGSMGPAWR